MLAGANVAITGRLRHLHGEPMCNRDVADVHEGQTIVVIGYPRVDSLGAETSSITEGIVSAKELEKQIKKWRESRARKSGHQTTADRRTVRVNGQDVLVITKARNKAEG